MTLPCFVVPKLIDPARRDTMAIGINGYGRAESGGAADFIDMWQAAKSVSDPGLDQLRAQASTPEQQFEVDMIELQRQNALDQLLFQATSNIEAKTEKTLEAIAANIR
jgi:hypothetical protein